MCGRYHLNWDDQPDAIIARLQRGSAGQVKTAGEIAPTDTVPVIALNRRGEPGVFAMRWGYAAEGGLIINARSESAHDKPLFADGMKQRRCLIPASRYYEWERRGKERIRYAVRPVGEERVYLAGLYRLCGAKGGAEFVILTRDAAQDIAFIHPRMPVMLPGQAHARWLNPEEEGRAVLDEALLHMDYGAM